ncbi:MAG: hypothetical protein ACLS29_05740 [Prevotellamassilia sp.]
MAHILGEVEQDTTPLDLIPAAVFTTPEAAMVGLTEEAARAAHSDIKVGKAYYRANGRALTMDAAGDGLVKLIATPTGELLGAHILGTHAAELIHELTLVIRLKGTVNDLRHTIHAHPTLSELILQAAEALE